MQIKFWESIKVVLPPNYEKEFNTILVRENAERVFLIALMGIFFFFLLLFLDVQRIMTGKFQESFFYQISAFLHICLAFFIIPAFVIQNNSKKITEGTYTYTNLLVYGSVFWMAAVLIFMSIFATIDRKSLATFLIFLIIVNLFLNLPKRIMNLVNIVSLLALSIGIYLIQQINQFVLTEAIIEALGISLPIILINRYQYYLRAKQFLNEKLIAEQNQLLQKSMEENFNRQLSKIEMRALRAQMNPHFLFNVLNSIKLYMVQNDGKTAAKYLTKFSRLIRLVLNNSKSTTVNLKDELEALRLYIEMENFRFNDRFDYEIALAPNLQTDLLEIPPLILQPYVENAIWHGLMHKNNGRGKLTITAEMLKEEKLLFTITDNGIGRARAKKLKTNSARKHQFKSVGMEITKDRLKATNQFYGTEASVEVEDRLDENKDIAGTIVKVFLPIAQ